MKIKKLRIMMLLSVVSCVALLNGCGSSSKEGTTSNGGAVLVDEGTCITCHSSTVDPASGTTILPEYAKSAHNPDNGGTAGCQGCHGGGAQHNGVGPIPYANPLALDATGKTQCNGCHTADSLIPGVVATANVNLNFATQCSHCHAAAANAGVHAAQATAAVLAANNTDKDDCVFCHNVSAPQHGSALVSDNNGVRSIVPEFQKTSHHIVNANGAPVTKAQCVVCHAEGTVASDGSSIVVDATFHMKDGNIYLRNGNATLGQTPDKSSLVATTVGGKAANVSVYAWNPTTPDHGLMDQFCFSCHNAGGAPTTFATLGQGGANDVHLATSSATNPFGDTISNGYDQMARAAVVNVYDAFAPANSSHHAVRAKKYSGRTRATVANAAVFTQYSGPAVNPGTVAPLKNANAGIGPLSPGSRYTIYEAGFFVSNYTPLGATATVADDSTLHCGDCHTVGQWKPNSTTAVTSNPDGTTTVVNNLPAIGAHGSVNEYMLRTSDGSDALHHQNPTDGASITSQNVGGTYVCFLCHRQGVYGSDEQYQRYAANPANTGGLTPAAYYATNPRLGGHGGLHPCNAPSYQSIGMTGASRIFHVTSVPGDGGGGGNLYGYTCAHCHNSGNKGFGGIHGGNAAWGTYSTNGAYATAANPGFNVTYRKSYRFMGGLSLRYNGGGSAAKWESQSLQVSNREGCYNFTVGPAGINAATNTQWVVGVPSDGVNPATTATNEFTDKANASQTFGTWGGCGQHNGSTTAGAGEPALRKVQRPLTY